MSKDEAYKLFENMIAEADKILRSFTAENTPAIEQKADKSLVTACDKEIDKHLTGLAVNSGFKVVSEEGEHVLDIVNSGNYLTIDPIDGTLGYIDYVNYSLENGGISTFLTKDLGPTSDFCLLLGIVENGEPKFGACYNFITKEKILIDAENPSNLIRENNVRNYNQKFAVYTDQRETNEIEQKLINLPEVTTIKQAALGLKSLYTILNPHDSAITCHKVQTAGLWDIMPTAVATRAFGGQVYDDTGEELKFKDYIILPGKGATIIKGDKFLFVKDLL